MKQSKPISAVVGSNLRTWREGAGLTQDEVARAAGGLGIEWTRATVAAIEGGRREVSLGEFLALPFIVNRLDARAGGGRFRRLVGFVAGGGAVVELAPDAMLSDADNNLVALVSGSAVSGRGRVPAGALRPRPGVEIPSRVESVLDAEQKAARSVGVTAMQVRAGSYQLWGRSLTDEREGRVGRRAGKDPSPRSLQAHRGHVTRELLGELEGIIGKPKRRHTRKEKKR